MPDQTANASPSFAPGGDIVARLETARTRLEERFLEGGAVLEASLQTVAAMIATLDRVTTAFDAAAVDATVTGLTATADDLRRLPEAQALRQSRMQELLSTASGLGAHVRAMQETMRYLRTFAVTVKITGAGAHEFTGFADEMLERIQQGRVEADGFACKLDQLIGQAGMAIGSGRDLERRYHDVVPVVARDLTSDAEGIGRYHHQVAQVAGELSALVKGVQGKVARVLSALQIGDITRQRIEHVQAGLVLAHASGQDADGPLLRMLAAQMEDLLEEFHSGCATVTSSLAGLAADTKEMLALGRRVRGEGNGDGFLRALEKSIAAAQGLVGRVEAAGRHADQVGRNAAATASELSAGVDAIRSIKTEITHMAINTSLRCSRMGEAGKPMNVVASELRVFAEQMETIAEGILTELERLSATAAQSGDEDAAAPALGEALDGALGQVRGSEARMESHLSELTSNGDEVARSVGLGVARLDFTRELGEVLEECAVALDNAAADAVAIGEDGHEDARGVDRERVFTSYTMAREREVHRRFFAPDAGKAPAASGPEGRRDELASVLF